MRLLLYQLAHSPFCIPITQALRALKIPFKTIEVPNADRSIIIKLTKGSYYQVPVLEDDKKVIFESDSSSQDVARHIDHKFGKGKLFPKHLEGLQTILIQYLENEVENVTFRLVDPKYLKSISDMTQRTMVLRHKERKFGRGCIQQWMKDAPALRKQTEILLQPFDRMLQHSKFLLGTIPVYSDFLLFGILGNLTYKNYNSLPGNLRALKKWHQQMSIFCFEGH
jgi:glutathione S-transferase